jgi:L-fucose mutarotase
MLVVGDPAALPEVQAQVQAELDRANEKAMPLVGIDRFAFYEAAKSAFAVVQVGDPRPYGCFLLRKGVIAGPPG